MSKYATFIYIALRGASAPAEHTHSKRTHINLPILLLQNEQNKIVFDLLKLGHTTLSSAPVGSNFHLVIESPPAVILTDRDGLCY